MTAEKWWRTVSVKGNRIFNQIINKSNEDINNLISIKDKYHQFQNQFKVKVQYQIIAPFIDYCFLNW